MLVSVKIELMKVVNIGNVPITKYIQMNVSLLILLCTIARFHSWSIDLQNFFIYITGNIFGDVSSLREHHDMGLCNDPASGGVGNSHRVEKRSYLPPVTCTSYHELNAVRSKVHCQPRPRVIRLPWPNDTSVQQVS